MGHFPHHVTRWPDGRIPYTIAPVVKNAARRNLETAIQKWNNAGVGIELVSRLAKDVNWVRFNGSLLSLGRRCSSAVGMQGLVQTIECSVFAAATGVPERTWLHEIGHAIGLTHEHQRIERDDFVWLNKGLALLAGESMHNYTKMLPISHATHGDYDCGSIMHYLTRTVGGVAALTYFSGKSTGCGGIGGSDLTAVDRATVLALYS